MQISTNHIHFFISYAVAFLAFGLVGFTVLAVALLAPAVLQGFDWRLGLVLGAVVAPTPVLAAPGAFTLIYFTSAVSIALPLSDSIGVNGLFGNAFNPDTI